MPLASERVAPKGASDEELAEALLAEHATTLPTALAVLEDVATQRNATPVSLLRAAEAGHTWLARLSSTAHKSHVVEPALLASIRPPTVSYVPAMPRRVGKCGVLSELQLEAVMHACQSHAQPLRPSGSRPGFLLADGAGVGKGRTIATIILDAWLQGHQRAIWVSASADLFADAKRDLQALCTASSGLPPLHTMLTSLTSVTQERAIPAARGVVFASYALLARPGRLAQVLAWCTSRGSFSGVVALDECHRAKAAGATGAGSAVIALQTELPLARVVYSSATSATEVREAPDRTPRKRSIQNAAALTPTRSLARSSLSLSCPSPARSSC
jgi:hypothetical protein